jgi:phage terminase large subunit GpA-like protein
MFASALSIKRDVAVMMRPPQRITVADSARANLRIVNPSGNSGNWSPDVAPYMVEPMNLARSRLFEAIVFVGPARSGKTIALVDGVLTYSVCDDPADCMIVQTSQAAAEDFSKMRIGRAIHGSPELQRRLSPRAHDDNVLLKFFRSGMSIRFGWPSVGQLSGKDIRRILMTDVDNFTGDLSIDECFSYALKRAQTYMSAGICIAESSPARDYVDGKWTRRHGSHEGPPADGICALFNRGDRRRLYWQCPECREPFEAAPGLDVFRLPDFEELKERVLVDDIVTLSERFSIPFCPSCGVGIDAKWKRSMTRGAKWIGEGQSMHTDGSVTGERIRSRTASFWMGGVAAAYQSWASLVERYLQAIKQFAHTGEQKALKATTNVDQALPWIPLAARAERHGHELEARATGDWSIMTVPEGVRFLTCQIDVQAGKRAGFEIMVTGWGVDRQHWPVDRYALRHSERIGPNGERLPLDPATYVEDWLILVEKCVTRRYALGDGSGRTMQVRMTACDLGGVEGVTPRAYAFSRLLKARGLQHKFRLVKGDGNSKAAPLMVESFPDSRKRSDRKAGSAADVPILLINSDKAADLVAADIWRATPGHGYWHFPRWFKTQWFEELTAETREAGGWANTAKRRNETWDHMKYGEALFIRMAANKIDWRRPPPWADEWNRNSEVAGDAAQATPTRPPSRPRVARSKYLGG